MENTTPLGEYLFQRIKQIGVSHVLGCPGDFNLTLLDHLYDVPGLKWIGCCNELNAAYACDGYARITGRPGCLVTTFGVGELSAMNGIAGACAEHAPILHIVGTTARVTQEEHIMIHHTMKENPDHTVYQRMSEPIRCASAFLTNETTAAEEIDRVIQECWRKAQPAYLFIPTDVTELQLDSKRLQVPLNLKIVNHDKTSEKTVIEETLKAIYSSRRPVILADVLTVRHRAGDMVKELADITKFPSCTCPLSKGVIDESSEYFAGLYNGNISFPGVQELVESADLVLNTGPLLSDSNTGAFSRNIAEANVIQLHPEYCVVKGKRFPDVHFVPVLNAVLEDLRRNIKQIPPVVCPKAPIARAAKSGSEITQDWAWTRIAEYLKDDDILLVESGTAQFGIPDGKFPKNLKFLTQTYWSSIGYALPATLGALVAKREENIKGRVILLEGDGSLHMTVQEIGTMIRYGFTPTIFVINNDGYTIERAIHGPKQEYNDISPLWQYQDMLKFFGAKKMRTYRAQTRDDLDRVLNDNEFNAGEIIQVCEVMMGKFDEPWRLTMQVKQIQGKNALANKAYAVRVRKQRGEKQEQ